MGLFTKLFGSYSDRELKRIQPIARAVEDREKACAALSDEELRGKTAELKQRLQDGETLDDILPDAFATAREAAWRVLGMKPFPVQIICPESGENLAQRKQCSAPEKFVRWANIVSRS